MTKPYQWLAWVATVSLLLAASLAAFNIYPYYIFAFIGANSLWILIGVLWQEKSLVIMNLGLTIIYVLGLIL
jgi:hypothetical protein